METTPASQGGKPDKQTAILRAALKAYGAYGIAKATTRQIAQMAGIGKSTIFEYFKSKEELQNAAFQLLLSGMAQGHRDLRELAEQDPVCALNRYIGSAIETALNEPHTLLLLSQYALGTLLTADRFETAREQYNHKMRSAMQDITEEFRFILARGMERNVFHPNADVPVNGLVFTVCALIREIQAQAFLQSRQELAATCAVIRDTIFRLLGMAPPPN